MHATRFAKLQSLFDRVCDLDEAEQRAQVLRATADDPALRDELERLLAAHRHLAAEPTVAPLPRMPDRIGPYRILEELGHGGMGTVYKAEQSEPVRRMLAIKVVQAGLGTKEVLARFHLERKALAAMNHRHIAKVFDAGATEQGLPYFAMELVEGQPLGEYCDRNRLDVRQRVQLFQQVCEGVQHAHLKGVVHRDLKPGNVLVVTEDSVPVAKILDFGLAKATDRDFVDVSLRTEKNQVLGTYEYMSPEQANGDSELVDARADIYSLGVMLYELLCGELPFATDLLRGSGRLEALRMIREQEPLRPSARLLAQPDRAAVAALRQTSLNALGRALRGDLDWIALKAMAKEPDRRYGAATLLAADLQRHLDFEPVLASPPSVGYRLRKFVRRYRVQCVAAAAVFVAIVGGAIGTWLGFSGKLAVERAESERNRIFADAARLAEARMKEAEIYPAWPGQVPALRSWLAGYGEPLADRLPQLGAKLVDLRSRARPRPADPNEVTTLRRERTRLRAELDKEDGEARRIELADQIRQIELEAEIRAFAFADDDDAFLHRTLTLLVRGLEQFTSPTGLLAGVRERLDEATTVQQRTIEAPRTRWDEAIAAIAASDGVTASAQYAHLALTPQLGLVPLGMDPDSRLWEFVHLASGTRGREIPARDAATGRLGPTGDMGIVFVLLPGGTLPVEAGQEPAPRNAVRLDTFFLAKYELTQGQRMRLLRLPIDAAAGQLALPAHGLNWFDARDLVRQQGCELPTQLQWEYGCRAGTCTPWWTGAAKESLVGKENVGDLTTVGALVGNPFGLFDTLGNAWEWCREAQGLPGSERAGDGERKADGTGYFTAHGGVYGVVHDADTRAGRFVGLSPSQRLPSLGVRACRRVLP